jgi:hypothetical protein
MKKILSVIIVLLMTGFTGAAWAEIDNKSSAVEIDILGVIVKFNDDDTFKSLKASATQNLNFTNSGAIRRAVSIATMQAKADVTKWMEEKISSDEGIAEVVKEVAKRSAARGKEFSDAASDEVTDYLRNLNNQASNILTGVTVISQKIDRDNMEVIVTVGVSSKYMKAAGKMRSETAKNIAIGRTAERKRNDEVSGSSSVTTSGGLSNDSSLSNNDSDYNERKYGVTHRRSPAYDDF